MSKIVISDDISEFKITVNSILDRIFGEIKDPKLSDLIVWIKEIYDYNVVNGKQIRAIFLVKSNQLMANMLGKDITEEDKLISHVLAWTIEILQAFALILDDIMDESETRRGSICWYKKRGMLAINDALVLEQHCYHILRLYLSEKPYYMKIVDLFHQISLMTTMGQFMDMKYNANASQHKFKNFTENNLETIYRYKTTYYTFVLPVQFAMIMNNLDSKENQLINERILNKIGHLFQMQDDFIDCFGEPSVTGKVGTDILDGKCCWPIVTALQMCDERQLEVLKSNYGLKCEENENTVKQIYSELNLIYVFESQILKLYKNIVTDIQALKVNHELCPEVYDLILGKIYKRVK